MALHRICRLYGSIAVDTIFSRSFLRSSSTATISSLADQFKKASEIPTKDVAPMGSSCKTHVTNPVQLCSKHSGLFYTVEKEESDRWMSRAFRPEFSRMSKALQETNIMVRRPALEVVSYLEAANYDLPALRFVFYGGNGCGKNVSMAHVMHYCGKSGWMVFHVPWGGFFNRYSKEQQMSSYKEGRVDQPLEAADLLSYFRYINEPILRKLDLRCSSKYVWTKRDVAEVGTPLLEVMDFALMRVKYATDILGVVLKELKLQAASKGFRLLMAVDGLNAFWGTTTIRREDNHHQFYDSSELTISHHIKKFVKNDWAGGAILCTVDQLADQLPEDKSYMPRYLLKKEGFEVMDPCIPIHVPNYSEKEMHSCLEYYLEKKWITNPKAFTEEGKNELIFLSQNNPLELYYNSVQW